MDSIGPAPLPPISARAPATLSAPSRREEPNDPAAVAEDFAAVLLTFVVREMWKGASLGEEGLFGSGAGGEIHRGFFEGALASSLASGGFSGLTEAIAESLERRLPAPIPEEPSR